MSTEIKRRRGTTTQHASFTGALGELTVDTTKDVVVVHDGSTVGGWPMAHGLDFATRAAFVSSTAGRSYPDGTIAFAANRGYIADSAATTFSDHPGWKPAFDTNIQADQWAIDLTGATDDRAQIVAMLSYCAGKKLNVPAGVMNWTATASAFSALAAYTTIRGAGERKTTLRMKVDSAAATRNGFTISNADCAFEDLTVEVNATVSGTTSIIFDMRGRRFRARRCRFYGGIVVSAGTPDRTVHVCSVHATTSFNDILFDECTFESVTFGWLKSNAATSIQNDVKFRNCRHINVWKNAMAINQPNGVSTGYVVDGGIFENTEAMSTTAMAVGLASGYQAVISDLIIRGHWWTAIHFEENVRSATITNITAELASGDFFDVTANNNVTGGAWSAPTKITLSGFTATKLDGREGTGLRLTHDANPFTCGDILSISSGSISGFETGALIGVWPDAVLRMANVEFIDNTYGVTLAKDGAFAINGIVFRGNDYDIRAIYGGTVVGPVFHVHDTVTRRHKVEDGVLEIRDAAWNLGRTTVADNTSKFDVLMRGIVRMHATLTLQSRAGGSYRTLYSTKLVWDGTTPTETVEESTTAGGFGGGIKIVDGVQTVTIDGGGTGYTVGDVLTASGGTLTPGGAPSCVLTVTSVAAGVITGVTVTDCGAYGTLPASTFGVTGGTGSGATFTQASTCKVVTSRVYNGSGGSRNINAQVSMDGYMAVQ